MQVTAIIDRSEAECDYLQLLHEAKPSVITSATLQYAFR